MTRVRALTGVVAAFAMIITGLATAPVASADPAPPDTATPTTVSGDALPAPQVDGVVWAQAIGGDIVVAGGSFSNTWPGGTQKGDNLTPAANVLAYNINTGELIDSFAPQLNGQVQAVEVTPDGSKVIVAGSFTEVNGVYWPRLAAFTLPDLELITSWRPQPNSSVVSIAVTDTTVYMGGYFNAVGPAARDGAAAVNLANGAPLDWDPQVSRWPDAMTLTPDGQRMILGGSEYVLNDSPEPVRVYGLASVDVVDGTTVYPFAANEVIRNYDEKASITTLVTDDTGIYGAGWWLGSPGGNFEGVFKADPYTGEIIFMDDCHGDTVSVFPTDDVVYQVGHDHYCANIDGGMPQSEPWTMSYTLVTTNSAENILQGPDPYGYAAFPGQPAPEFLHFRPRFEGVGWVNNRGQAGWHVTGNDDYVIIGGEFTNVNGTPASGIVRFGKQDKAPNKVRPEWLPELQPTVTSPRRGEVHVAWQTAYDADNGQLTYKVFRDTSSFSGTPLYEVTVDDNQWWNRRSLSFVDTTAQPGQRHTYYVYAFDPFGNWTRRDPTSVVTATDTPDEYASVILDDSPEHYYRMDETSGGVPDLGGSAPIDVYSGAGISAGASGALLDSSDGASTLSGGSAGVSTALTKATLQSFAIEAWFKTSSTRGGRIVGYGTHPRNNNSRFRDRHIYLTNSGSPICGVETPSGAKRTISGPTAMNNGQWHHVVCNFDIDGMTFYVDGQRVGKRTDVSEARFYAGRLRLGADNLDGWPSRPSDKGMSGQIDEVAVYPAPLTAAQVASHYRASGRTLDLPEPPADEYGAAVFDYDPDLYWRLGESSGGTAVDSGLSGNDGTINPPVTLGVPGALDGVSDTAYRFSGGATSGGHVVASTQVSDPSVFTTSAWFRTTTTTGGKIIGFGNQSSGESTSYDRHSYMQDDGRLVFGVWTGSPNTITTDEAYNDGQWHNVVATLSSAGMRLYVDGELVGTNPQTDAQDYSGYWRIGGDRTWGSTDNFFTGDIDEALVLSSALTATQVAQLYALGSGETPNAVPTAEFTVTDVTDLTVQLDASASTDTDGTIASYNWDFDNDGTIDTTTTVPTTEHTYATASTYTIGLTVTDNDDATSDTYTDLVTVTAPNEAPTAEFTVTDVTDLTVQLDASASEDTDGTIASYNWDFDNDGTIDTTTTVPTTEHTYATASTYTIGLTVTDNDDATSDKYTDLVTVTAPNEPPTAEFPSPTSPT